MRAGEFCCRVPVCTIRLSSIIAKRCPSLKAAVCWTLRWNARRKNNAPRAYLWSVCQLGCRNGTSLTGARELLPKIWSAAFSPIIIDGAFRLPLVIRGNRDESAQNRFSVPMTRQSGLTTASGSSGDPIRQVPHGW